MTDAQTIMKLIDEVDPNDISELSKVDAHVELYLGGHAKEIRKELNSPDWVVRKEFVLFGREHNNWYSPTEYTRSRDALKAIRPDGSEFTMTPEYTDIGIRTGKYNCGIAVIRDEGKTTYHGDDAIWLHTEELAELYAIIIAIEYERTQP